MHMLILRKDFARTWDIPARVGRPLEGEDLLLLLPPSPGGPVLKQISADAKLTSDMITWVNNHHL